MVIDSYNLSNNIKYRFRGLVVMISVLHTEGPQFDPGRNQFFLLKCLFTIHCKSCIQALPVLICKATRFHPAGPLLPLTFAHPQ